jgi:signal peptidase I
MTPDNPPQENTAPDAKPGTGARLHSLWREWRGFIVFLLIMFSFRSAIADWNDVPSGSMLPTILIGDRILVDKLAYDLKVPFTTIHLSTWGQPVRGDIVVFYSPQDGVRLVKRVIGVPGDEIAMQDNHLIINGTPLDYKTRNMLPGEFPGVSDSQEYRIEQLGDKSHRMLITPERMAMRSFEPVKVPAGWFWMMGDNRDNSNDSRFIGMVPRGEILGRASRVVISLDPGHWYMPRANRFFSPLD